MARMLCVFGLLLTVSSSTFAQTAADADAFFAEARDLSARYEYEAAIDAYTRAMAIDQALGAARREDLGYDWSGIGFCLYALGRYEKALEYYEKALALAEELGQKREAARRLNNIGVMHRMRGQYDQAMACYRRALAIDEALGDQGEIVTDLGNIGMVFERRGRFDQALEHYQRALSIAEGLGNQDDISSFLNSIGDVYVSWGRYEQALDYYRKALALAEELEQQDQSADVHCSLGVVYRLLGKYAEALGHLQQALAIDTEARNRSAIASDLSNIGLVYDSWKQYDQALDYYRKALAIDEELGRKDNIAVRLSNIGAVYSSWKQYDQALAYYRKALAIDEELGEKSKVAIRLANIGTAHWYLGDYPQAAEHFTRSVQIVEELRRTATGAVRRDYLASQIETYQWLASACIRGKAPDRAFNTVELSSAKYLLEQLGARGDEKAVRFADIGKYRKKMGGGTAVISYSSSQNTLMGTARIFVDRSSIQALELDDRGLVQSIQGRYGKPIEATAEKLRGIRIISREPAAEAADLNRILIHYRALLSRPELEPAEREAMRFIGRQLYDFLLGGIEKHLQGKTELVIIPGGMLAFLPFEALIMPDGRYVIEKYTVRYCQSLTVEELLADRKYGATRKPFLGFGGAVYDAEQDRADTLVSGKQLRQLQDETLARLQAGTSTRSAYNTLGLAGWSDLPGTLAEVNAIKGLFKGAEAYTGEAVDEAKIKSLSRSGALRTYKVLHFATHGLSVPEIPELSALVLSQFKTERNDEDGYLTMNEIAALELNADLVTLSACETGLGRIYSGEGVVGLTQAFLVAGANGVSVSLWPVADQSTMKFMVGIYTLVKEKGLSYARAMAEMKRAFIAGSVRPDAPASGGDGRQPQESRYASPFHWAPFVYYGR